MADSIEHKVNIIKAKNFPSVALCHAGKKLNGMKQQKNGK